MTTTRRVFLKALGATAGAASLGSLAAVGTACGQLPSNAPATPTSTKAGDLPQGLSFLAGQPVILGRDAQGIYAMSSICTHAGCDMSSSGAISGNEVDCYCHGSAFDQNGAPQYGPAFQPLPHWRVDVAADGSFTVQVGSQVSPQVRVPVPAPSSSSGTPAAG